MATQTDTDRSPACRDEAHDNCAVDDEIRFMQGRSPFPCWCPCHTGFDAVPEHLGQ